VFTLRNILRALIESAPGSQGAAIINSDGVVIDTLASSLSVEPASGLSEYGLVAQQLNSVRELLETGEHVDYTVQTPQRTTLMRRVNQHYFLAVWMGPSEHLGRARFRLRLAASQLAVYP